jgi:alpha-L-rhamnosidase
VNASFQSLYGLIKSEWKLETGRFIWKVTVPPNSAATIYIPTNDPASILESGRNIEKSTGIKFSRIENNLAIYEIGSGNYEFSSSIKLN